MSITVNMKTTRIEEGEDIVIEVKFITLEQHKMIIEAIPFFERLGGKERAYRKTTCAGHKVHKLISISPDQKIRVERDFIFEESA